MIGCRCTSFLPCEHVLASQDPGTQGQRLSSRDLSSLGRATYGRMSDTSHRRSLIECHPAFRLALARRMRWDPSLVSRGSDELSGPCIAFGSAEPGLAQELRDMRVIADEGEDSNGLDHVRRRATATPACSLAYTQLGVHAAFPVNHQRDLARARVEISHDFLDEGACQSLLEDHVGRRRVP